MTSVAKKISEFEALRAERDAVAKKPLVPPISSVHIVYRTPDGATVHEGDMPLTILTFDECMRRDTMAGVLAGGNWHLLPFDAQAKCRAIATVKTVWPKHPEWVDWLLEYDDEATHQLAEAVEEHRRAYFLGGGGEGEKAEKKPRLALTPSGVAGPPKK